MKFYELACSFMSLFAVLITCYFLKWAISWTSWRKSVSSNTVIRNWLVLATRNKWNFRSESGVDHFEYWYFHLATMTYSHKIYEYYLIMLDWWLLYISISIPIPNPSHSSLTKLLDKRPFINVRCFVCVKIAMIVHYRRKGRMWRGG